MKMDKEPENSPLVPDEEEFQEIGSVDNNSSQPMTLADLPELRGKTMRLGREWIGGKKVPSGTSWRWEWEPPEGVDVSKDAKNSWWRGKEQSRGVNPINPNKRLILSQVIDNDSLFITISEEDPWIQLRLEPNGVFTIYGFKDGSNEIKTESARCAVACHNFLAPGKKLNLGGAYQEFCEAIWVAATLAGVKTSYTPTEQRAKELLNIEVLNRPGLPGCIDNFLLGLTKN